MGKNAEASFLKMKPSREVGDSPTRQSLVHSVLQAPRSGALEIDTSPLRYQSFKISSEPDEVPCLDVMILQGGGEDKVEIN